MRHWVEVDRNADEATNPAIGNGRHNVFGAGHDAIFPLDVVQMVVGRIDAAVGVVVGAGEVGDADAVLGRVDDHVQIRRVGHRLVEGDDRVAGCRSAACAAAAAAETITATERRIAIGVRRGTTRARAPGHPGRRQHHCQHQQCRLHGSLTSYFQPARPPRQFATTARRNAPTLRRSAVSRRARNFIGPRHFQFDSAIFSAPVVGSL